MPASTAVADLIDADKELARQQERWPDIAVTLQPARALLAVKLREAKLAELRQRKAAIEAEEEALLSDTPDESDTVTAEADDVSPEEQRRMSLEAGLRQTIEAMQRKIAVQAPRTVKGDGDRGYSDTGASLHRGAIPAPAALSPLWSGWSGGAIPTPAEV